MSSRIRSRSGRLTLLRYPHHHQNCHRIRPSPPPSLMKSSGPSSDVGAISCQTVRSSSSNRHFSHARHHLSHPPSTSHLHLSHHRHRQHLIATIIRHLIMLPVLLSVITRALVTGDNCFGGVETFEKIATTDYVPSSVPMVGVLLQQDNVALTRDCINLCKQQQRCNSFTLDYRQFQCSSFAETSRRHREHMQLSKTSNLFEKVCLKGITKQEFDHVCGNERLWAFERVKDSFLDGFVEKELTNMVDREECVKACLTETSFICRSADFDEVHRICRMSKENRRTQPQAFVNVKNSQRDYMENQCAPSGPASCIYMTKSESNVFSMDSLQFATSSDDCQLQCDRETSFNCRAYSFLNNRCMLSADDEKSIGKLPTIPLKGATFGERTCVAELCTNGIFTYEKITGHVLRSAITTPVELTDYSSFGVTGWCRESCDVAQLNCPAFTVNYQNNRCERLDRNTQGRTSDLIPREGESYFEKICLRVPQIMSQCQDKFWAFERVLGYELAPVLYVKNLNFVQSRRDCEEYCLQEREFPCRSALYNDETTECKLSPEDRRTSPGHYYRSRSMKINYLENQCVRAHSSCPYTRMADSYPTYTDIVETNSITSNEICEKMCNDNRHFLCRSYAYYSSNGQCFLSGDDSASGGSASVQKRSSIMYYERQCSKLPALNNNNSHPLANPDPGSGSNLPGSSTDDYRGVNTAGFIDSMGSNRPSSPPYPSPYPPHPSSSYPSHPSSSYPSHPSSSYPSHPSSYPPYPTPSHEHGQGTNNEYPGRMPSTSSSTPTSGDIELPANQNKEVVITNGTLGGIITTRYTRFPESLVPTIPPKVDTGLFDPVSNSYSNMPYTDRTSSDLYSTLNPDLGTATNQGPFDSSSKPYQRPNDPNFDQNNPNSRYPFSISSNKKCAPNARFLFEKVTSFEPIGGHLTLLYTDLQNPGIVTECAKRCEHSAMCRAFVVDYYHQSCHGLFENSSVGSLDLRLSMGKDYFEGFCVPNHVHCEKFWPFDRIIDQVTVGARPEDIVRFISRSECRTRCLEERKFRCLSASYNSFTHECHLYAEDRNSGSLSLQFSKGIDFMENQCVIDVKSCRYHAIERDISIVSVTKSMRGTSTFHCEQACDYEKEFNCRSYTYLDNPDGSLAPGGNLCLLSADNRATSHQGSMQFRPRALYAEKDCAFHQSRIGSNLNQQSPPRPSNTNQMRFYGSSSPSSSSLPSSSSSLPYRSPASSLAPINSNQATAARNMPDENVPDFNGLMGSTNDMENSNRSHNGYHPQNVQHTNGDDITQLQHIPPRCDDNDFTFEKTFGYDLRYARRERAPIPPRPGVVNYCHEECVRLGDRCMAFVVEYGDNQQQNCYFLDEAASEHRNQLNKLVGTSYIEKICLREKSCGKLWTFERIIGYTLEETADKEISSIMLRTSCQDLCLAQTSFVCRSITYDYGRRLCRLFKETRRSKPTSFKPTSDSVDYFENKCAKELSTCQYRDFQDRYFAYVDRILIASSLTDCQRQCDSEQSFQCKSVNYDSISRECSLSSEDSLAFGTLNLHQLPPISTGNNLDSSIASHHPDSVFSEKGNCEQVSVQCNQQDMMLALNFESPFYGRVYTKSNPAQCYVNGNGNTQLQFAIPLNSRCGTHQESTSNYVNEVIVQQHSVIMTESDRTIRVLCSFEISDQTITLGSAEQSNIPIAPNGIDVSVKTNGRSYSDGKTPTTLVTNTAAPPSIGMRILDHTGHDAQVVSLGDDLTLRIELKDQKGSAFAMFARNLYARSSNGESLFLIDSNGCPIDYSVFPALKLDPSDNRSLYSKFKAFRFPTTGVVNFEVQIRFCQEYCEPIKCAQTDGHVNSFGRRRRRRKRQTESVNNKFHEIIYSASNNNNNNNATTYNFDQISQQTEEQFIVQQTSDDFVHSQLPPSPVTANPTTVSTASNAMIANNLQMSDSLSSNLSIHSANAEAMNNNSSDHNDAQIFNTGASVATTNSTIEYNRTPSNKTGFAYPSSNYRHYSNRNLNWQPFLELNPPNESTDSHHDNNNKFNINDNGLKSDESNDGDNSWGVDSNFLNQNHPTSESASTAIYFDRNSNNNNPNILTESDYYSNSNNNADAAARTINENLFGSNLAPHLSAANAKLPDLAKTASVKTVGHYRLPADVHLEWNGININGNGAAAAAADRTMPHNGNNNHDNNNNDQLSESYSVNRPKFNLANSNDVFYRPSTADHRNTDREISHDLNALSNAALPLPSSPTEVPLSLAIMVDDYAGGEPDDKIDNGIANQFDEQASSYESSTESAPYTNNEDEENNDNLNYADMAKLQTRNDFRYIHADKSRLDKKETGLLSTCSEECGNTGIVIFLTTLIVTVVHLTLATTVYLYLAKLKKSAKRQQRFHHEYMANSGLNSLAPSTSSSISSLGKGDDSFSFGEDGFATSAMVIANNGETRNQQAYALNATTGNLPHQQANNDPASGAKPSKWFGMMATNDHTHPQQQHHFGSIKSAFNRENVFFGQKEQRFLGLNNYAFGQIGRNNPKIEH